MRVRLLVILLAGPLVAQETPVDPVVSMDPVELAGLVAALNGPSAKREHAAKKLLELQEPNVVIAIEAIEEALPEFRYDGQASAVKLLRLLPEGPARPVLRRLLAAKSPHLRLCAGLALHGTGEPDLVKVMTGALDAPDLERDDYRAMSDRLIDFDAFGKDGAAGVLIRPERTEEFLLWFFTAPSIREERDATKAAAVIAETDKRALPMGLAAAYLVRHRKSDYSAALGAALAADGFPANRFAAIRTILHAKVGDGERKPPEIAAKVIAVAATKQKNGELVRSMLLYLRAVKHPRLRPVSLKVIEHPSDAAALAAFAELASLKVRPSDEALRRVVDKGPDGAALEAATLLLRVDDAIGFERTLRCARDNKNLRRKAIGLLGEFQKPQAMDWLIVALSDDDFLVRQAAYSAAQKTLTKIFPYRRFRWPRVLANSRSDPAVRKAAIETVRAWWDENKDADW